MIIPITIACGKRYGDLAEISVRSFLKHHPDHPLIVLVDPKTREQLRPICDEYENFNMIAIHKYIEKAKKLVGFRGFAKYTFEGTNEKHNKMYSSLKPIVKQLAVGNRFPDREWILSIDVDSYFSGNILDHVEKLLKLCDRKYNMFMVTRKDKRMQCTGAFQPGSGFTMWNRHSPFMKIFVKNFSAKCVGVHGGSQDLINHIRRRKKIHCKMLNNPMLHFVSPDMVRPNMSSAEIRKIQPAYIHLHGPRSLERVKRFQRAFEEGV